MTKDWGRQSNNTYFDRTAATKKQTISIFEENFTFTQCSTLDQFGIYQLEQVFKYEV